MHKRFPYLWIIAALVAALLTPVTASAAAAAHAFAEEIPLPDGWLPEGIDIGPGKQLYSGSRANGAVYRADLRTGEGEVFVEGVEGRIAVGLKFDRRCDVLVVAGGTTGQGYIYDGDSGDLVQLYQFTPPSPPGQTPQTTFINDVVVTKDAAYFTNSAQPELYRVDFSDCNFTGDFDVIALDEGWDQVEGFNANGLVASQNGKYLIVVNSTTGNLYRVDPDTGETVQVDLGADGVVTQGDGLALRGKKLYVVRNRANEILEIRMNRDWTEGRVTDQITQENFDVPTTIAFFGNALYAVNARFTTPPTPETTYNVVRVDLKRQR